MEVLDFEIEYNRVGVEYYDVYTKAINNPADIKLQTQLKTLTQECNKLDLKRQKFRRDGVKMDYIYEFNPVWTAGAAVIPFVSDYNQ